MSVVRPGQSFSSASQYRSHRPDSWLLLRTTYMVLDLGIIIHIQFHFSTCTQTLASRCSNKDCICTGVPIISIVLNQNRTRTEPKQNQIKSNRTVAPHQHPLHPTDPCSFIYSKNIEFDTHTPSLPTKNTSPHLHISQLTINHAIQERPPLPDKLCLQSLLH